MNKCEWEKLKLTTMSKDLLHKTGCWGQWLKEPISNGVPVVEDLPMVGTNVTLAAEEGVWSTVAATHNGWSGLT